MLIGKLLERFRAEVLDAFFKGMNPRRMQSIKISHASGASIGITGLTLEEACFLLSGKGDGSKLPLRGLSIVAAHLQRSVVPVLLPRRSGIGQSSHVVEP